MRRLTLLLLFFCTCLAASAQKLNDNSVIKDSSGYIYPAPIWKSLLMRGYSVRPIEPGNKNTEFLLVKLTEQQIADRMEKMPKPRESEYFKTGKKISLFKTTDMDGNKLDLKNLDGRIVVMNFWFINCPPCRMEIPDLNELVDSFKNNDRVVFVAIALDQRADLKEFFKTTPFNYNMIDNGEYYAKNYGIRGFPTHVIVDPEGKVYFHTTGLAQNTVYWIKKSIRELLAKEPATALNN